MKRIGAIILIILVIAVTFGSCKSSQDCPAYSNNQLTEETTENVA